MRRLFVALTTAVVVLASAGTALAQPPATPPGKAIAQGHQQDHETHGPLPKVDICHYSADEDSYHLINVSENALAAHLAHGDGLIGDAVPEMDGYVFIEDCEFQEVQTVDLSPETVLANGGVYDNDEVANAIEAGYTGTVVMTRDADSADVSFSFTFSGLAPNATYEVWLDGDGGTAGGFVLLGSFVTDGDGNGVFQYDVTLATGLYTWSFWINQTLPIAASILQTDADIVFTIP